MAQSLIGNLAVLLTMETAAFEEGGSHASKLLRRTQREFEATAQKIGNIGKTLSIGLTAPLTAFAAKGIAEARETAAAMAQVNAALASMGPVAGRTAEQLTGFADKLELASLYEGDQILKDVTANLLTFGNIAGTNFDRAQQAAVDLATRMDGDLKGAALLVGKALNDPIKGMGALGKAGIQFSADQKAAIKAFVDTGNAAGAQNIILGEFQRQFGGAAAAAQNADPLNKASDAFNQMAETVGTALLPIIPPLTEAIVSVANAFSSLSPETQKWIIIGAGVAAAVGPILLGFGGLVSLFGTALPLLVKIGPLLASLGPAFTLLGAGFSAAAAGIAVAGKALLGLLLNPIVLGAAVLIGGIYLAWKHWDKIVPIVQKMVSGVTGWLGKLAWPFKWVIDKLTVLGKAFFQLYDKVVGHSYIPDMVSEIGVEMAKLDVLMVQPAKKAAKDTGEAFRALQERFRSLLGELFPEAAQRNQFASDLALITEQATKAKWSVEQLAEAVARLKVARGVTKLETEELSSAQGESSGLPHEFGTFMGKKIGEFGDEAKKTTAEVADAFGQMAQSAIGSVRNMVDSFKSGDILGGIQSLLDVVTTVIEALGSVGVIKGGAPAFGGARAKGGPVSAGKSYLVGERGPEFITPRRSGYVHPNGSGTAQRIQIVPSPYFDVVIDGRAANVAAPMSARAAMMGAAGGQQATMRQARRQIP